jgi:hypothetical protein
VSRFTLAILGGALLAGAAGVVLARLLGRSESRAALLVGVVAHWLGAWVLWTFAGGLALSAGALRAYDGSLFGLLALGLGAWQYRMRVHAGREPALVVFVGGQLAWLAIVLLQNGLLRR